MRKWLLDPAELHQYILQYAQSTYFDTHGYDDELSLVGLLGLPRTLRITTLKSKEDTRAVECRGAAPAI
jgi:hypothetical protein